MSKYFSECVWVCVLVEMPLPEVVDLWGKIKGGF